MNYYSALLCFFLFVMSSQAQEFVEFEKAEVNQITKDLVVTITLSFKILEGYHIQSESKIVEDIISTEIIFDHSPSFEIVSHEFTLKNNEIVVLNQFEHKVLVDILNIEVKLKLNNSNSLLYNSLSGRLNYQACTDKQCLFPRTLKFKVPEIQENINKKNT